MTYIHKQVFGQGKPVVLIHGWAMHSGVWREFAEQLAAHYQVICLDLPGHGLSENIDSFTLKEISESLIKAVPEPTFSILGWSLGASVAITLAKQFPGRVNSLILLAGNPQFVQSKDWPGMKSDLLANFASNLQLNHSATLIRFLALQVYGLPNSKIILKQLKNVLQQCPLPTGEVLQNGLKILQEEDLRSIFAFLQCPINCIQGDKDALIPAQLGLEMQKLQPTCKINIIPQASHVPFLSHPSKVIEIINHII